MSIRSTLGQEVYNPYFALGVPLSREAWERYHLREILAQADARTDLGARHAVRVLAHRINEHRDFTRKAPPPPAHPGQLLSFCTLTEILRYVFDLYCLEQNPGVLFRGLTRVAQRHGADVVDRTLPAFVHLFPPEPVQTGEGGETDYLLGCAEDRPNRYACGREMLMLLISRDNPAARSFHDLYDDTGLRRTSPYGVAVDTLDGYFDNEPPFTPSGATLMKLLRAPMRASPEDIEGQLEFIRREWAAFLPESLLKRLMTTLDALREERQIRGFGPGPALVPDYRTAYGRGAAGYDEPERFTQDRDWMSNVVLIAKSVYVWLHQLSKDYRRPITRLDEIPDEALDRLARWGFTGLWLIGVWERSSASRKIKQHMGNPEALASAYSLYDYVVAQDLGGDRAYFALKERAWRRGIRLASDMVPNHVGIYSKWLIEHPDWFIQNHHPPYPSYQFGGPDLSEDPRVSIRIEDGYYRHSDAAVVFQRVDNWTGDTRYIYHGNDGTHMPWNDTAQLNYLLPEVREAVIQTILYVARHFPIIRFDAAMTLAKKHYQRLWFPQPGEGGAIPSRADYSMTREQFDQHMPEEFWREVVERVQQELPDTLLLAEAFWLMEGYFVRTLGMHRVYNSAFMNMLKMEENGKYRATVRNVLEFSPEVLKRFVNFMNNPDELTAVEQFGRGDKYFGVCLMMVTMPGLPMFGHGQIEGYTEKYGMEYARAYWDETVDQHLVHRHEQEIFPLMRRRYLFSGVENFAFFDFVTPDGQVDENVFAYSNRAFGERALVLYNNAFATTNGWVDLSTAVNVGTADYPHLIRKTLAEALNLRPDPDIYYLFRDYRTGLEYIRAGRELGEKGLYAELHAYEYHVFMDFREMHDSDGRWASTAAYLAGRGVPSIEEAQREQYLAPLLKQFHRLFRPENLTAAALAMMGVEEAAAEWDAALATDLAAVLLTAREYVDHTFDAGAITAEVRGTMAKLHSVTERARTAKRPPAAMKYIAERLPQGPHDVDATSFWHIPVAWAILRHLGRVHSPEGFLEESRWCMDEWLLRAALEDAFVAGNSPRTQARSDALLVEILVTQSARLYENHDRSLGDTLDRLLSDPAVQRSLDVHEYQGAVYLVQEPFEHLLYWLLLTGAIDAAQRPGVSARALQTHMNAAFTKLKQLVKAAEQGGYRIHAMLESLVPAAPSEKGRNKGRRKAGSERSTGPRR